MNDFWPEQIMLRWIVSEIAHASNTRIVITGQTIGPLYGHSSMRAVQRTLALAQVIGVREAHSLKLCQELIPDQKKVFLNPDDAMFWPDANDRAEMFGDGSKAVGGYVIASFTPWHGFSSTPARHLEVCSDMVKKVHEVTGLPVFLMPQEGRDKSDQRSHDIAFHDLIVSGISNQCITSMRIQSSLDCTRFVRESSLVVSARYHPIVFAVGEGVPAIGIAVDHYTHTKLEGVIAMFSNLPAVVPAPLYRSADFESALRHIWESRHNIASTSTVMRTAASRRQSRWWDFVCSHEHASGSSPPNQIWTESAPAPVDISPAFERLRDDCENLTCASKAAWENLISPLRAAQKQQKVTICVLNSRSSEVAKLTEYVESLKTNLRAKITEVEELKKYNESLKSTLEAKSAELDGLKA